MHIQRDCESKGEWVKGNNTDAHQMQTATNVLLNLLKWIWHQLGQVIGNTGRKKDSISLLFRCLTQQTGLNAMDEEFSRKDNSLQLLGLCTSMHIISMQWPSEQYFELQRVIWETQYSVCKDLSNPTTFQKRINPTRHVTCIL